MLLDLLQCMDGSYCDASTLGWGCCANKGGRARCPPNYITMCNTPNQCGGGTAYCCEMDCSSYGGNRPCPSEGTCAGSMDIASDNAYALYINGEYQANVKIPSSEFQRICKDMAILGDTMYYPLGDLSFWQCSISY